MPIKESSDELKPSVDVRDEIAPRKRRTAGDCLALAVSTCGVGYFPIAPGTMGSLLGVVIYVTIWTAAVPFFETKVSNLLQIFTPLLTLMLIVISFITIAGTWAASRTERILQKKDPSIVVIDEVAGQMIALLSGPFWLPTWWSILSAFILFRAFDIWKPYPIRRLENLESGLGIMADDIAAGAYALIVNSVLISGYLLIYPRSF